MVNTINTNNTNNSYNAHNSHNIFPHKRKEKLAAKISKIKRKKDLVKIFEIIREDSSTVTENNNGMFMYFHNLKYETYIKLEKYISQTNQQNYSTSTNSEESTHKKEYKPYTIDDFPSQQNFSPKLKYSNKEKNLIKRQQYDDNINIENKTNESILYCNFDVSNLTDSDVLVSESSDKINKIIQKN